MAKPKVTRTPPESHYKTFEKAKTTNLTLPKYINITAENGETEKFPIIYIKMYSNYFYNQVVDFFEANINNFKEISKANLPVPQFASADIIRWTIEFCHYHREDADNEKFLVSRPAVVFDEWDQKQFFPVLNRQELMDIITAAYNLKIRKLVEYCSVEFAGLMQDWYTSQGRNETEILNKFASHNGHNENPIMQHLNEFLGAEIKKNSGQKQSRATVDGNGFKFQNSRVNIINGQKHKTL